MKKKNKKSKTKETPLIISMFPLLMEPVKHPNEVQEDPINEKFEKTIEITTFGPEWR